MNTPERPIPARLVWKTDRSRMAAYQDCPRLRYLKYHYGGAGIERVALSLPRVNGSFFHAVAAVALVGGDWEASLAAELEAYQQDAASRGVEGSPDMSQNLIMMEGLARLWIARRLPRILAEFRVLEVEREHVWTMAEGMQDMVRCDGLLERKDDGAWFLQEYKTARAFGPTWAAQFTHNSQILANINAMEAVTGHRIEGVIIEGILKAPYLHTAWSDRRGVLHLKGRAGWEKVPIGSARAWIAHPAWTDLDRDGLFNALTPRRPTSAHLARWHRQAVIQERKIAAALHRIGTSPDMVLDSDFPLVDDHCQKFAGHPCEMEKLCFTEEVAADPLGSGLYQPRTPHHTTEESND